MGLALGVVAGEAMLRVLGIDYRPHMRNRVYFAEPDPVLGWRNRRGMSGPYGGDEFLTWVTINEAGQRGPSHPEHRSDAYRVAILGDSQAWGDGVADHQLFAALLDRDGVEALNFSCPGYGTDQQLLAFDHLAVRYAPDVALIVVYVGNDLADNLSRGTWQYPKPYFEIAGSGELVLRGVPVPASPILHGAIEVYRGVMRHSALLNVLSEASKGPWPGLFATDRASAAPREVSHSFYTRDMTPRDRLGFVITARLLVEAAEHARAIGARPVVLILPELWQIEVANQPARRERLRAIGVQWRRPQQVFARVLGEAGVEVIDALPTLARASEGGFRSGDHTYYRRGRHLNARGHEVIARLLRARLGLRHPDRQPDS
jgi:hypothetical protein